MVQFLLGFFIGSSTLMVVLVVANKIMERKRANERQMRVREQRRKLPTYTEFFAEN